MRKGTTLCMPNAKLASSPTPWLRRRCWREHFVCVCECACACVCVYTKSTAYVCLCVCFVGQAKQLPFSHIQNQKKTQKKKRTQHMQSAIRFTVIVGESSLFFLVHFNCFYLQLEFAQYRYTHVQLDSHSVWHSHLLRCGSVCDSFRFRFGCFWGHTERAPDAGIFSDSCCGGT